MIQVNFAAHCSPNDQNMSVGFCRGSRVEGKMSSVEGKMSRVDGKMSRVICFVNISRLALPASFPPFLKSRNARI